MKKEFYFFCLSFLLLHGISMAQAPTIPASNITFSSLDGNSYRVGWTNGNGARRIVVMRQGSAVTALPADGTDYNASSVFGNGDAIQPGQFVVFDAGSTFVDISGLQPGVIYHVAIFEYNGTASSTVYLTTTFPTAGQAPFSAPTLQISNIAFSNVTGNSATLTWTNGDGQRRLVVARQGGAVNANPVDLTVYTNNSIFGNGTQIGTGNYSVYSSSGTSVTVTNLQPNTGYHYALFEYNGLNGPVYLVPGATVNATTAPRPSVAASNFTFTSLEGGSMRVNWTSGNGARRIVVARAGSPVSAVPADGVDYNASNTFGNGDAILPGEFVVFDGTNAFADISGLSPATTYHFRVYEYDGTGANIAYMTTGFLAGSQATLSAPAVQASNVNFTNISGSSLTVNWTNGSGNRRVVLARQGSPVNADPVNLTFYSGNSIFGNGTQVGTGNFVVFSGTTSSVTVTNLQINTTYHFAVYEQNGVSGPVYLIPGALANITTPAAPTIPASTISFNSIEGGSFRMNWTSGNGARRIVIARQDNPVTAVPADGIDYNASSTFGNGDAVQPGEFVVFDGTGSFVDLNGMVPATTYHFRIFEYNGAGSNTSYLISSFASGSQATLSPPVTQAGGIGFTNIGGSSLQVNWTNGSGNGRIVVARAGGPVDADPIDLSFYNGNSNFGSGSQIGTGNFVVFRATNSASTVTVTNLSPSTTYHFAVYEFNGFSGPVYLVPGAMANAMTAPQPTIPATNLTFNIIEGNSFRANWSNGNGTRRIVVGRAGTAVTALPVNGVDYNPSSVFGNGDAIQPGQFVLFDGTAGFVDLTNLSPATNYHFAIFEYDGTGTNTAYLVSTFLSGSQSTMLPPTVQATNVLFSSIGATSLTVGWTVGNGSNRIVLAREGSPVNADPVDLSLYTANASFGAGAQIGTGNYVVYRSSGTSANVNGLTSGTTYHFAVFEFNGFSGPVYLVPGAAGSTTTLGPPQVQAANATTGMITETTMQLNWTNGSGNRRLVLMKQGSAVDAAPVDNTAYTANSAFGAGNQLGTGNFVVFNSTGNSVLVTGLMPNTTYHFAVYEFNDFGASSQFLLTNPATGSGTTSVALPVTFIDFIARNEKNNIRLEWSTAQEFNSSHFEIQKGAGGSSQGFVTIGIVNAAGESSSRREYAYTDNFPFAGTSFYRIRQVDKDGRFMYSKIVSIRYEPTGLIRRVVNPVQDNLFVELTLFATGSGNAWIIYDLNGQVVHRASFSGQTIYGILPFMTAGLYVLEVRVGDKIERLKIIKSK